MCKTTDPRRSLAGSRSHAAGALFEQMIEAAIRIYERNGNCAIDKTPEPMKPLRPYREHPGQFIAVFTKQAQPDFKGILEDATMILFDAKHTDAGRIRRQVVSEEQEECFERYSAMGAMCFIVVSLGFERFFRVPWVVFKDMQQIYGHKYMNAKELEPYRVPALRGIPLFLNGIELKERSTHESAEMGTRQQDQEAPHGGSETDFCADPAKYPG